MANKAEEKIKIIEAPIALTSDELEHYEYWLAASQACGWLIRTPKDKESKDIVRNFMVLYAKVKKAMQAVKPGKINVCVGKCLVTGKPLVIESGWYETPESEAAFAMSFFQAYCASVTSSNALEKAIAKGNHDSAVLLRRIQELEEDLERKNLRIRDLENAVKKAEEVAKDMNNQCHRSQGRLPGKRMVRVKTVPIKFKGNKR